MANSAQNDSAPAQAVKAGFTRLAFFDDFDSLETIDTEATGNDGYKWYVDKPWDFPSASPGHYSVKDSILTIKGQTHFNWTLATVSSKGKKGFGYTHGYVEFRFKYDRKGLTNEQAGKFGFPALWTLSRQKILGSPLRYVEIDFFEAYCNGLKTSLHEYMLDSDGSTDVYDLYTYEENAKWPDDDFHTLGVVWKEGLMEYYIDDTLYASFKYSGDGLPKPLPRKYSRVGAGIIREPDADDPLFKGSLSVMDQEEMAIIIGSPAKWPIELDWVRVWQ